MNVVEEVRCVRFAGKDEVLFLFLFLFLFYFYYSSVRLLALTMGPTIKIPGEEAHNEWVGDGEGFLYWGTGFIFIWRA
jgi:hypothetical protein